MLTPLCDRFQSKVKDCRTVLSEMDFRETRLNYYVRGGIHVEIREVLGNERWEVKDYSWREGRQDLSPTLGAGALDLKYHLTPKIRQQVKRFTPSSNK
jgi:hypothetical protein